MVVHAFPHPQSVTVRRLELNDIPATSHVFQDAVRRGASAHYTLAERIAWAPTIKDASAWKTRRLAQPTWVAEIAGEVIGFSDLTADDEIAMLFVDPDFTRRGVGLALLEEVERHARDQGRGRLHAHASLVGEPVFARRGFAVINREWVEKNGERLARAVMEKVLEPEPG